MNFLNPGAFFLALLLPLIIIMYLLRLRRKEKVISSTYLWNRMIRDFEANAPWQRLRRNLLLLLQLIFLISLIFSLAGPFTWRQGIDASTVIMILDTSASMGATDVRPNRLEAAKDQAQRLVEDFPPETSVTIISAGDKAKVVLSASKDRRQIRQALESLQVGVTGSDMMVALQIASATAAPHPDSNIIILSDGNVSLTSQIALDGTIKYYPIGVRGENQAISLLTLEKQPGDQGVSVFAQITNYGQSFASRRLTISADNNLINAYDLHMEPGEQTAILLEGLTSNPQIIEAKLLPPNNDTIDDLISDDRAFAVTRQASPIQITLVSEGNRFLETALSLIPNANLLRLTPGEESELPESNLTIFDAYTPITETLPSGNLFYIAPLTSTEFFSVTGKLENPQPIPADINDTLLNNVLVDQVAILDSAAIPKPKWARPVLIADGTGATPDTSLPLLFAGEIDDHRIAVLSFDLRRSDLPLQLAFPILLVNLVQWMSPGPSSDIPTQVFPGEPLIFYTPIPPPSEVVITQPGGASTNITTTEQQIVYADTKRLGVYQVSWLDEGQEKPLSYYFSVNLFSPNESTTQPKTTVSIPGVVSEELTGELTEQTREMWWREIAIFSLVILMIEWLYYRRATVVRLFSLLKIRLPELTAKR